MRAGAKSSFFAVQSINPAAPAAFAGTLPTLPMLRMNSLPTRARRSWAMMMLFAAALAGCGDATAPLPVEGAPDELAYSVNGAESGTSTSVQLEGAAVVVTRSQWTHEKGLRTERVRAVPTAADWTAFWAAVERAGVRQWTGDYEAEGVRDGASWSLRLTGGGQVLESHGVNAYPDREGNEHHMHQTADFRVFLDALGALAGTEL